MTGAMTYMYDEGQSAYSMYACSPALASCGRGHGPSLPRAPEAPPTLHPPPAPQRAPVHK